MGETALEALKQEIRELARKEAERIIEEAKIKADAIIKQAKQRAEEIARAKVERGIKEARRNISSRIAAIKMKRRQEIARLKEEYVEKVFQEVHKRLEEFVANNREEYAKVLRNLVLEALSEISSHGDEFLILINEKDRDILYEALADIEERMYKALGRRIRLSIEEELECMGGAIVATKDRRVYYNNTLEARLHYARERYAERILRILFG
ncbi:MAG: hypothetical protein J7L11_01550 [Thermoprotei archaeon]|nr:hypothetical protein [Thermoprotei archaeon]